jgi:hypothetical protein
MEVISVPLLVASKFIMLSPKLGASPTLHFVELLYQNHIVKMFLNLFDNLIDNRNLESNIVNSKPSISKSGL